MSAETLTSIQEMLYMFAFLAVELTCLFLIISYFVGILQYYIPPKRIEEILSARHGKGYIIAAFLGATTPFCSCSTIPFLKGLLRAKAGFGPMLVFLFASPLLNPIIIGLFAATFGLKVTITYFMIAFTVSITAAFLLEKLGFARYIKQPEVSPTPDCQAQTRCCSKKNKASKWKQIWDVTWKDFKKTLPYLMLGVSVGAVIYGFMPTDLITKHAGHDNLLAIPVSAVIGIPLYIRAEAVIPLSAALAEKGMSLGAIMALIIGSAGASLTEVILLRAIFKTPMIIAFLTVVLGMAVGAGLFYTLFFG